MAARRLPRPQWSVGKARVVVYRAFVGSRGRQAREFEVFPCTFEEEKKKLRSPGLGFSYTARMNPIAVGRRSACCRARSPAEHRCYSEPPAKNVRSSLAKLLRFFCPFLPSVADQSIHPSVRAAAVSAYNWIHHNTIRTYGNECVEVKVRRNTLFRADGRTKGAQGLRFVCVAISEAATCVLRK